MDLQKLGMLERGASCKRRRTETAPPAALSAPHTAVVERIAHELAVLAEEAPGVPQLADCSAQLATLLVQPPLSEGTLFAGELGAVLFDALPPGVVEIVLLHCDARSLGRMSCVSRFFGADNFSFRQDLSTC